MRITKDNQTNFKSALTNKYLLRSLEMVAEHGASFTATTSFVMSVGVRPLAINMTPGVKKENKQNASASSFCSALMKLGIMEAIAYPIENAVKKIDKNPNKFLKTSTIVNFQKNNKHLIDSNAYRLATQTLKLGTSLLSAIPKSICTVALIPIVLDTLFSERKSAKFNPNSSLKKNCEEINFKGRDFLSKSISKILNNKHYQEFALKYQHLEQDIAKHISAATDILLTGSYAVCLNKNDRIDNNQKRPLIFNSLIATTMTLLGGYPLDNFIKQRMHPFVKRFATENQNNPKLAKYLEGLNIIRPALIFASIYYIALPMASVYLAEKVSDFTKK